MKPFIYSYSAFCSLFPHTHSTEMQLICTYNFQKSLSCLCNQKTKQNKTKKLVDACHCCKNHLRQRVNTAFSVLHVLKVTRFSRYFLSPFFVQSSVDQGEMRVNEFHKNLMSFCFIIPFVKIKPLIFFSFYISFGLCSFS